MKRFEEIRFIFQHLDALEEKTGTNKETQRTLSFWKFGITKESHHLVLFPIFSLIRKTVDLNCNSNLLETAAFVNNFSNQLLCFPFVKQN